jgi:TolB protein
MGALPSGFTRGIEARVPRSWSPDGTRILFQSDREGNSEIYTIKADGSDLRRLTDNPANDENPTWSPDGRRIAFSSSRDGNAEIYVMDAEGGLPTRLTRNPAKDDTPVWSPMAAGSPLSPPATGIARST